MPNIVGVECEISGEAPIERMIAVLLDMARMVRERQEGTITHYGLTYSVMFTTEEVEIEEDDQW